MAVKILKQIVALGGRRQHTQIDLLSASFPGTYTLVLISDYLPFPMFPHSGVLATPKSRGGCFLLEYRMHYALWEIPSHALLVHQYLQPH